MKFCAEESHPANSFGTILEGGGRALERGVADAWGDGGGGDVQVVESESGGGAGGGVEVQEVSTVRA